MKQRIILAGLSIAFGFGAWFIGEPALQHYRIAHLVESPKTGHLGMDQPIGQPIQNLPDSVFKRLPGEDDRTLATRLNTTIHESTWHCYPSDYELSDIEEHVYRKVMKADDILSEGILIRGRFSCGFCHQRSTLLVEALTANGIVARVWGLSGHVVVHAELPDEHVYLDPDYGVGPMNGSKSSIIEGYSARPYADPGSILAMYESSEDNDAYSPGDYPATIDAQRRLFQEADRIAVDKAVAGGSLLSLSILFAALAAFGGLRRAPNGGLWSFRSKTV